MEMILDLKIRGESSDPAENHRRRVAFDEAASKLRVITSCPDLRANLRRLGAWLLSNPPGTSLSSTDLGVLLSVDDVLRAYLDKLGQRDKIVESASKLIGARGTVAKAGQKFAILDNRQRSYLGGSGGASPTECMLQYGVIPVPRAQGQAVDVA